MRAISRGSYTFPFMRPCISGNGPAYSKGLVDGLHYKLPCLVIQLQEDFLI